MFGEELLEYKERNSLQPTRFRFSLHFHLVPFILDCDFVSVCLQTARQMPGMSSRESEGSSQSGARADGSTESDGYSSTSITTTHGVR